MSKDRTTFRSRTTTLTWPIAVLMSFPNGIFATFPFSLSWLVQMGTLIMTSISANSNWSGAIFALLIIGVHWSIIYRILPLILLPILLLVSHLHRLLALPVTTHGPLDSLFVSSERFSALILRSQRILIVILVFRWTFGPFLSILRISALPSWWTLITRVINDRIHE